MRTLVCIFEIHQSSPGDEGGVSCSSSDNSTASSAFSTQHHHVRIPKTAQAPMRTNSEQQSYYRVPRLTKMGDNSLYELVE